MSKQIKELKQFLQGTVSSPDSTDIPEEANVYSKNLEPLDEIGKLKGAKEDRKFRGNTPITVTIKDFATGEVAGDSGGTTTAAADALNTNANIYTYGDSNVYILQASEVVSVVVNSQTCTSVTVGSSSDAVGAINAHNDAMENLAINVKALSGVEECDTMAYEKEGQTTEAVLLHELMITFPTTVDDKEVSVTIGSSTGRGLVTDETDYPALNATNMIQFSDNNKQNLAYYSKTVDDTEIPGYELDATTAEQTTASANPVDTFRMKVFSNLNSDPERIISFTNKDGVEEYNDIASQPNRVSLQKQNQSIYIGTGNEKSTKSKWMGKINHSQFGSKLDGYVLEDAECVPVETGEGTFNLSHIRNP